jgi:hypothetical protein
LLQDWAVGFRRSCTLLLNTATVFLLGLLGLSALTPYLDYLLVPLFVIFLLLGLYGWMQGAKIIITRK